MRIPSGVTDQVVYFVALDATDLKTRETGLSSFTVYRARNGAAAAQMTTPTVAEVDATNMPGVYALTLDEDMTIGAGNDSEEMVFHITHAGMAPVTRAIELYRPKITAGVTLGVESDGDLTKVNTLDGHTPQTGDSFARLGAPAGASLAADVAALPTADENADAVWDELAVAHATAGTFGKQVADILFDTGNTLPGTLSTIEGKIDTVDANVDALLVDLADGTVVVGSMSTGAITADAIAADALDGKGDWNTTTPPTAGAIADQVWDETTIGHQNAGSFGKTATDILTDTGTDIPATLSTINGKIDTIDTNVDAVLVDTGTDIPALIGALNDVSVADIWTSSLTESYAADGAAFTAAQGLFMLWSAVAEFSISGTTITAKKLDGTTAAMTFTIDDASDPTSRTRAS